MTTSKGGRPKKAASEKVVPLGVSLSPEAYEKLQHQCRNNGKSKSDHVSWMILNYGTDSLYKIAEWLEQFGALGGWLVSRDQGSSSLYMAGVALSGKVITTPHGERPHPRDHYDLGRCIRLVEQVPGVRGSFPVLRKASVKWEKVVDNWDDLVEAYQIGDYCTTTDKMREMFSEPY